MHLADCSVRNHLQMGKQAIEVMREKNLKQMKEI